MQLIDFIVKMDYPIVQEYDSSMDGVDLLPVSDYVQVPMQVQENAEYREMHSVLMDGGENYAVSAVAFDAFEELLWVGNQGGHLTSYHGLHLDKYTSFQVHVSDEVRHIQTWDEGVLALSSNTVRCNSRQGLIMFNYSNEAMEDMRCMLLTSPTTLLMGGHQDTLLEIDLSRVELIQEVTIQESDCAILRSTNRFICSGDTSGKITLRDPKTLKAEHVFEAHSGTLSDFDIHGNLLVSCGFSNRMGSLAIDRVLMVYDMRVFRAVAPIQIAVEPILLRFVPTFTSRLAVMSQSGQFQLVETAAISQATLSMHQVNTAGALNTFDISASCQAFAFGDSGGYVHLFGCGQHTSFNPYSRETELADPVEPLPPIDINDELTPLSIIPMPYCNGKLLSDWPESCLKKVYRRAPPVTPEILQSMKVVQFIGYAPNPGGRLRNQMPYKLNETKKSSNHKSSLPESTTTRGDGPFFSVPKRYRKVGIKYSKLGLEDFDFRHYNQTRFSGLEPHIPNAYCNAMLQVLYFNSPLKAAVESHLCSREFCLACELGFLFHMLDKGIGQPCQASNFLRAFRTIPEASALGLILNDAEESMGKVNLPRLIQSWTRFILQQLHTETVEKDSEEENNIGIDSSGNYDTAHPSFISRLYGTELLSCTQCRCGLETSRESSTLLFSLLYPDLPHQNNTGSEKVPQQISFCEVLARNMCLEQITQAWCDKCDKYQPTIQSRCIKTLPSVLAINCQIDTDKEVEFWRNQLKFLKKNDMATFPPVVMFPKSHKLCRYGNSCTRHNCRYVHNRSTRNEIEVPVGTMSIEDVSPTSWVPLGLRVKLNPGGTLHIIPIPVQSSEEDNPDYVEYELVATVAHIKDTKLGNSLVSCIKVSSDFCNSEKFNVSQWFLFNDFCINPIPEEEAVDFNLEWKFPCVLNFAKKELMATYPVEMKNPLHVGLLFDDETTLVARSTRRHAAFTPLGINELFEPGDIVAMDAEFVTLNQEEAELRSDGTRSTIKPSQMSVARITCIRGQGPLEGSAFIDDYISTQEQVVDYLTKFSGIKPGDLDATTSSKHLTTLKSTYLKLRLLIDIGVIFVGHGLKNDFRMINLVIPSEQVIDTVMLFHLPHQRMISLRFLAWYFLGLQIQSETHDSIEDARTALKLYRKYQKLMKGKDKFKDMLQDLYDKGRTMQWKVPNMD